MFIQGVTIIDKNQLEAVRHKDGPMMVLAGPGSGKTTVITHRTRYLIKEAGVNPANVLVITFTKAAAREMKERFLSLMDGEKVPVSFGTFHAVFFMILKYAYGYKASDIIREDEKYAFFREYIYRNRLDFEDEKEFIHDLLSEISKVKNSEIVPENFYSACCPAEVFRRAFHDYQKFLISRHSLDFDDMLVYCKDLFVQRKDILKAWQKKYKYILIDEFQDINPLQFDIIRMMAEPENNLFIVGDDDQSVYRFRGARPELMLNFPACYPDAKCVTLGINYRSGREIVEHASNLISWNEKRYQKALRAGQDVEGRVVFRHFQTQRSQNLYMIGEIRRLLREGMQPEKIAILSRTNRQLMYLMEQLSAYDIPYYSREHIPNLYEHWIARDLLTYIRIALGDRSRRNFLRIMNRPNRYLSRDGLPVEPVSFDQWKKYYRQQDWMVRRLSKLEQDLSVVKGMKPYSAVIYLRKAVGYETFLKDYAEVRGIDREDLLEVLEELTDSSREYDSFENWLDHIRSVQEEMKVKARMVQEDHADAVTITTYHSSKGLEYEAVFLPDLDEKISPYRKAVLDDDIEEERRALYVAMTRAERYLYLMDCRQIRNKEMDPSRFLDEMMKKKDRR